MSKKYHSSLESWFFWTYVFTLMRISFLRDETRQKWPVKGTSTLIIDSGFQVSGVRFQCLTSPFPET